MKRYISLFLVTLLALSLVGCTSESTTEEVASSYTYADTIQWDAQYDVVVLGFGGAGAVSASTAADTGSSVLIVEKAPEGEEGGNTRVSGQLFAYGDNDPEGTFAYYQDMAAGHHIPEDLLRVYTDNIADMYNVMEDLLGIEQSEFYDWSEILKVASPEYPEFTAAESISLNTVHEGFFDGYLWQHLRALVTDRSENIDVWFESPATQLIQEPVTNTIIGVKVERNGEEVNVRANNGVVMATGGFENNPEMIANYLGLTKYQPIGGLYNTGDGVKMSMEVGADLWHMEAYEGIGAFAGGVFRTETGKRAVYINAGKGFGIGSTIIVDDLGQRFFKEDEATRHGHTSHGKTYPNMRWPESTFIIWDQNTYDAVKDNTRLDGTVIYEANSIAELASTLDMPAENLEETVANFNSYAVTGNDIEFDRDAANMEQLSGDKYYAAEICANVLNTQGGPMKNVNAEVLDVKGNVIPNLYVAGELGGITAFQYQGGGNIAECVIFGKIAGTNASTVKETLPVYEPLKPVESTPTTLGEVSDITVFEYDLKENQLMGSANGVGGLLYVVLTMDGDKIENIEVVHHNETNGISDPALATIPGAILESQSIDVDNVSGATVTSKAIKAAVETALGTK